jgi:hypothetical protein
MIRRTGSPAEPDAPDVAAGHPGLRRRRGARTRAPPRSHSTSRARISVPRNLWWPPGVTTDPSRPSDAHRFTVLGFTLNIKATCPVVSNRSAPSASSATHHPFPGREVRSHHPGHARTAALVKPRGMPTAEASHLPCRRRKSIPPGISPSTDATQRHHPPPRSTDGPASAPLRSAGGPCRCPAVSDRPMVVARPLESARLALRGAPGDTPRPELINRTVRNRQRHRRFGAEARPPAAEPGRTNDRRPKPGRAAGRVGCT